MLRDAATAADLLDAGDDDGAAALSASALARYRGDPLDGAGDWAAPHRARLDEARAELMETEFAARLRRGAAGDLIGELESAVATYAYREGLWELLISALYRAGRQADALATYQRVRARLADDLGLAPGPRLQELERQILVHDHGPRCPRRPRAPATCRRCRLQLVGRDAEIAAVAALLASDRLVEIVGPGGIGKTAVAIATGRRLTGDARRRLAGQAGERDDRRRRARHRDRRAGRPAARARCSSGSRRSDAVVILDNCEHVVDAAATLAVRLLDAAPGSGSSAPARSRSTSTARPCSSSRRSRSTTSVELFTRRAAARHRDSPGEAVHDLCRSLDGLPLAIELAAARTKTLSIEEIGRRLDDRFSVLSDPTSRKPERRRALKATIQWSYELLFPDDQRGLWALATFAGGAPLPAVESVLEALDVPASAAIDVVGRLASRSLVIVDDDGAAVRYRLLDSIRAFALEAMAESGLTGRALAAHAAWFADAAGASTEGVRSGRQAEHLAFARTERPNIDAALAWSATHDPLLALEHRQRVRLGLDRPRRQPRRAAHPRRARCRRRGCAGPRPRRRAAARGVDRGIDGSARARARARRGGHRAGRGDRRRRPAGALRLPPRLRRVAPRRVGRGDGADRPRRALYDGLDRPWDQAANWLFAARAAISAGDRARAAEARDQVEHWLQSVDDPWLHVRRDAMLGELARIEHRFDDAVLHLARAAETSGRLGFRQTEAYQLSSLGRAQCQAGDYATGAATLALAIEKAEATGDVRLAALARVHLGRVLRALGQPHRHGRRSRRRPPGTAPPGAGSRPRSANACSRRWTPTRRPRRGAAARRDPRRRPAR